MSGFLFRELYKNGYDENLECYCEEILYEVIQDNSIEVAPGVFALASDNMKSGTNRRCVESSVNKKESLVSGALLGHYFASPDSNFLSARIADLVK